MKKIFVVVFLIAISILSCKEDKKDKVQVKKEVKVAKETVKTANNVDTTTSVVRWKGTKPGGEHFGTVSLKSGVIKIVDNHLKSGKFVIDMTSIKDTDMPADDKYNAKLVKHLKSKDFFDVTKYPTAKFIITKVEDINNKLMVTGNLTIKEITKSITIPATVTVNEGLITFKSEIFKVDRSDFGVKYKSKKFFNNLKDKFIDDLMEISFDVKAKH